ncbi:hypothetical protein [Bacillus sp. JCM 19041]|uniref:hypothetical protein n=1 Tax=Bacillus sp. JCM 19041 TaxID=1460637 RepID=UPI0006CFE5C2
MSILSIIVALIFCCLTIFQLLLSLGKPYGEAAMGGYHKVLPTPLRIVSAANALILLLFAAAFLLYTDVLPTPWSWLPLTTIVWIITIFLAINTLANAFSRSKKERIIMTPLSGLTFILCLIIILN